MPLIVKDPRGVLTAAPETPRTQLTSSVDLAPLLLTIGTGSDALAQRPALLAHRRARGPRGDPRRPQRARARLRAARHRRDRHRVRDRAVRRRRAAARRRDAHARRPSSRRTPTGPTKASSRSPKGRKPSCTTTARRTGAWSCTTAPTTARSRKACARNTSARSSEELRGPLPPRLVAAHGARLRRLLLDRRHASRQCRRDGANAAANAKPGRPPACRPSTPFERLAGDPDRRGEVPITAPAASSACTAT